MKGLEIGRYLIIAFTVLVLLSMFWYFSTIVAYVLISVVLSFVGRPLVEFLGKLKYKKHIIPVGICAAISLVLIWFVLILFFRTFIPLVVSEAEEFSKIDVQSALANLKEPIHKLEDIASKYSTSGEPVDFLKLLSEKIISVLEISKVSSLFGSVAGVLGNIFVALFSISFITFFFLKDGSLFGDTIASVVPAKHEDSIIHVLASIKKLLMRYFLGIFIEVTLVGFMVTIGLTIVGVGFSHAVVIGLFAGMMNVIPYIGPIIGAIFGLVVGLAINVNLNFYSEILPLLGYMSIVFVVVQIIDNIFFQPLIYSNSVNAHPLEIFLVILMAGSMAGIVGMVLAIPIYTILRVIAKEFFNRYRFVKKLTGKIQ